ncbi:SGNH/GDSL hydrolase family protein [Nocardiopsis sp. HUAS JQ3]|uniref:SGNH/GDSL hydrolase family protein n=1 Tax=Nocardiopsis sp. HUAS JQ3 TaxID=3061629 RepID=UPI0023A9991F|nr:SGNH/GDSL hydrolase family protein [Nocardiopsis sp. HUAS JQ3]WDZ92312.1 SGNH/GDSL hydrolase family protein [Nocardiopsis sp. HUAS JQ3]
MSARGEDPEAPEPVPADPSAVGRVPGSAPREPEGDPHAGQDAAVAAPGCSSDGDGARGSTQPAREDTSGRDADSTGGADAHGGSGDGTDDGGDGGDGTDDGSGGEDGEGRPRRRRRRSRVAAAVSVTLILVMVAVLALPATREGLVSLWCETTDGVCPAEELPPITEEEQTDWRVRMEPEEAALWGNYVALGDSYSSGDGAGDYAPDTAEAGGCWRSENAYPRVVAEEFDFTGSLAFYACSSHKGSEMIEQIGTSGSQIERVTENTSLVTLGIGGNDLGFIPVLRTCMVRMPLLESSVCVEQEEEVDRRMRTFEETLTEILGEVRDRAPDARVLVLGYPRLFPADPPGMYYTLTRSDQLWLNGLAQRFNELIRDTAYRVDGDVYGGRQTGSVEYVNTFSALTGHEVSADAAWLNGIVLGQLGEGLRVDRASFHPTAQGQLSIAERVRLQIVEGPEREVYVARETLEKVDPEQLRSELGGPLDPEFATEPPGNEADAP